MVDGLKRLNELFLDLLSEVLNNVFIKGNFQINLANTDPLELLSVACYGHQFWAAETHAEATSIKCNMLRYFHTTDLFQYPPENIGNPLVFPYFQGV